MASIRKLPSGNYQVQVHIDGKLKSIGSFKTKKEAVAHRKEQNSIKSNAKLGKPFKVNIPKPYYK